MSNQQSTAADRHAGLILVGVDGSDASISALRWAVVEGGCTNSRVEAVYVYANPPEIGWYVRSPGRLPPTLPPDRAAVVRSAEEELARAVSRAVGEGSTTSLTTMVVQNISPSAALAHLARNADLLVVGAHHLTGIGRLFGSTTAGVLRHSRCPVVVVPGPEITRSSETVSDALAPV
jgi:nucleotide-binding universal stress UspA family protein